MGGGGGYHLNQAVSLLQTFRWLNVINCLIWPDDDSTAAAADNGDKCHVCMQVVQFDGGEYNYMAGEFNELEKVSTEEWNMIENVVKKQKFKES